MNLRDFYQNLPLINQVDRYEFYIPGYTEALGLFEGVRVVMSEEWLQGVPLDLQDYFYRAGFPCYFVPIFDGDECFGFVVKGFGRETPRFCTNMLLPGCGDVRPGELVVLVEGFKDCYLPIKACSELPVKVVPMLTSVPGRELLGYFKELHCTMLFVPDNDAHFGDHAARFSEVCGKVGIPGGIFQLGHVEDFGDFFNTDKRAGALEDAKQLREQAKRMGFV